VGGTGRLAMAPPKVAAMSPGGTKTGAGGGLNDDDTVSTVLGWLSTWVPPALLTTIWPVPPPTSPTRATLVWPFSPTWPATVVPRTPIVITGVRTCMASGAAWEI